MKRISLLTLLLFLFISCNLWADNNSDENDGNAPNLPIDNGYPYFLSGTVFPDDQGQLEFNIVPTYFYAKHRRDTLWVQQMSYGITDAWQIYVSGIPFMIHRQPNLVIRRRVILSDHWIEESGNGDTLIGTEYSWMYIKRTTCSAAVTFDVSIPTGDINKNLTDGMYYYTPTVIVTKDFIHNKWRTQLFAQTGISFAQTGKHHVDRRLDEPPAHFFIFNGGIAARSEKINYSLEFNWMTSTWNHNGDDNEMYVTPGVFFYIRKDVAFGVGVPLGLTRTAADYQIIGNLMIDVDTIFSKKSTEAESKKGDNKTSTSKNKTTSRARSRTFEQRESAPASSPKRGSFAF